HIQGAVFINPGAGSITLNVDDQHDQAPVGYYSLDGSSIAWVSSPVQVSYSGVNALILNGQTSGSALYIIDGTENLLGASTTINTGPAIATVIVYNTASTLDIVGGGGNVRVGLGFSGSVEGILGVVNIENPAGRDAIGIDDNANPSPVKW